MRKGILIAGMLMVLFVNVGITAYAATTNTITSPQGLGLGRITGIRGYEFITPVLNQFGITRIDIANARNSGKTLYDLAEEKGISQDQLKSAIYGERAKAVDNAVSKGTITKEQGDTIKANLKINMDNCLENFGQMQGRGRGMGRKMN